MHGQIVKNYTELIKMPTMAERFEYLKLGGEIGKRTFGGDRYLNQVLYKSPEWRSFRNRIIIRDSGCEMAMQGFEILKDLIIIHHINPLSVDDIRNRSTAIFDEDNVVCVSDRIHKAIHYGNSNALPEEYIPRTPNDTCPWRK